MSEMPDLEGMSIEEQMRWLESLASRQGVDKDQLLTEADIDVPMPSADTVIDEPGYVPYSESSGSASSSQKSAAPKEQTPPPPKPESVPEPPQPAQTPPAAAASSDEAMFADPLAFLESLAARQGADKAQFLTKADMDVPEPPADSVIDEPGYVPYEISSDSGSKKSSKPKAKPAPPPPPAPESQVEKEQAAADPMAWLENIAAQQSGPPQSGPQQSAQPEQPEAAPDIPAQPEVMEQPPADEIPQPADADASMMADPMAWLESLAARRGAKREELLTEANIDVPEPPADTVIDEPGYVPYDTGAKKPADEKPEPSQPPEPAVQETAADPMAWLDNLSAEESAQPAADLSEMDFADEEEIAGFEEMPLSPDIPLEPVAETAAEADTGADPMAWIEGLAAESSGAEMPAEAEIVEAEYIDYDPFGGEADEPPAVVTPEPAAVTDVIPELENTWGEGRPPAEMEVGVEQAAAVLGMYPVQEFDVEPEDFQEISVAPTTQQDGDPLDGLSDEEVEQMFANDQLTREQQAAWLERQAEKFAEIRENEDTLEQETAVPAEELPPAEPAELPDWVQQQMAGAMEETAGEGDDAFDVPDWLVEEEALVAESFAQANAADEIDKAATTPDVAELEEVDEGGDWLTAAKDDIDEIGGVADILAGVGEEQDEADDWFNGGELTELPPEATEDPWVAALEGERLQQQDESDLPDWYKQAIESASDEDQDAVAESEPAVMESTPETPAEEPFEAQVEDVADDGSFEPAFDTEGAGLPDWLSELTDDQTEQEGMESMPFSEMPEEVLDMDEAVRGEIPEWLSQIAEQSDAESEMPITTSIKHWLRDQEETVDGLPDVEPSIDEEDLPAWLSETSETEEEAVPTWLAEAAQTEDEAPPVLAAEPEPEVESTPPEPAPVAPQIQPPAAVTPPAPEPKPAVEHSASEYAALLKEARQLAGQDRAASFERYETLIDGLQFLNEIAQDVYKVIQNDPEDLTARRLLGDIYMRLGRLQEALDTYRGVLDQL